MMTLEEMSERITKLEREVSGLRLERIAIRTILQEFHDGEITRSPVAIAKIRAIVEE